MYDHVHTPHCTLTARGELHSRDDEYSDDDAWLSIAMRIITSVKDAWLSTVVSVQVR